jgi:UDP-N-acetylglucosamine 4,6-dehydratase
MFVIKPSHPWWQKGNWVHARELPSGFRYTSDTNEEWLSHEQLQDLIEPETAVKVRVSA